MKPPIVDATYKTNCAKISLVCIESVYNLNKHNVFDEHLELFKLLSSQKDFQSKEQLEVNNDISTKVIEKRTLDKYFEDEWMSCGDPDTQMLDLAHIKTYSYWDNIVAIILSV
ncbi:hypothetical protein PHYBLDRAFT_64435 [Phycomyces blakesleeanus NRRL 1555(-)]|uniref:Uncharacterized protein n=1 Tax=Phycomyces blakesleeanus (strain ATCC 8743b / DSM 1359 / FGSC 10004 / NBRC 33097 / NRRL 1555) TaxID=763407 RepID=A0A167NAT7_PHYB8|nr:hypothetical protein PHYBLDRAFT_64435 [Phycomyces blakesleeanus NRRL 1555(-)]OAD75524.1 hypothetical protein PHYBLDRAFT_64435 [Phycomyces blakesleeanus NRRL 1555(-)]|eukprot:XP_018293564.1 hypothetical protein PHYBLDRAFT_64435 [Phycomyces blakesleeanus NRRL 1555(-)]